jgi:hypothetical protein
MKLPDNDIAYFFELETSLYKKQICNSADAASALLADAFIEFGSSGRVFNKSSIIEIMQRKRWINKSPSKTLPHKNLPQTWCWSHISVRRVQGINWQSPRCEVQFGSALMENGR